MLKTIIAITAIAIAMSAGVAYGHSGWATEDNGYPEAGDAWVDAIPLGNCSIDGGETFTVPVRQYGNEPVLAYTNVPQGNWPDSLESDVRFIVHDADGYHWAKWSDRSNPEVHDFPGVGIFHHDHDYLCTGVFPDLVIDGWATEVVTEHGQCHDLDDGSNWGSVRTVRVDGNEYDIVRDRPGDPNHPLFHLVAQYAITFYRHGHIQDGEFWMPAGYFMGEPYSAVPRCRIVAAPATEYSDPWW